MTTQQSSLTSRHVFFPHSNPLHYNYSVISTFIGENNNLLVMQMIGRLKRPSLADGWYLKGGMWSFGYFCQEIDL